MTTITGRCPVCAQAFTSTAHQHPPRRYCCTRCRKIAWRRRNPRSRSRHAPVPRPDDVAPAVPRPDARPAAGAAATEPAARCPHCARPIAVITLLVDPAAAQVPLPGARP